MQKKNGFKRDLNSKENKNKRHAEFISASRLVFDFKSGEILKRVQDDNIFYNSVKGFTLIELLVVVLIIGILAAVALPQYQKAVEKSKATQAITLLKSTYQAADAYYLANGVWPNRFDEIALDFSLDASATTTREDYRYNKDWTIGLFNNGLNAGGAGVWATRREGKYKGGTFYIWKEGFTPSQVLLCAEKYGNNGMNANNKGDYCIKLFRGTVVYDGSDNSIYTMP